MKEANIGKMVAWGLSVILAVAFILHGWPKVVGDAETTNKFIAWGYQANFATIIGIIEIVAAILVLIPRVSLLGVFAIIVVMGGAIYTHLITDIGSPMFAIILLCFALILAYLRLIHLGWIGRRSEA